jgi:hypothetical protein
MPIKNCVTKLKKNMDIRKVTISTTDGFRDLTKEYKASKLNLSQFISITMDRLRKRDCVGICVQEPVLNKNKIKTVVKNEVQKGTRKWQLMYVVYDYNSVKSIASYSTKTDAIKKAREYTESTQRTTTINVEKCSPTPSRVAKIEYKRSDKEAPGEYVFFGYAAE